MRWIGNLIGLVVWVAIVYAVCVWIFHLTPTTTYYITGGIGVLAVASWLIPKKKVKQG